LIFDFSPITNKRTGSLQFRVNYLSLLVTFEPNTVNMLVYLRSWLSDDI